MKLYKAMERRYAQSLVEHGRIRIGTLNDYKRTEHLHEAISDNSEGKKTIRVGLYSSDHPEDHSTHIEKLIGKKFKGFKGVYVTDSNFTEYAPDCPVFCFAESVDGLRKHVDPQYDCLITFERVKEFSRIVCIALCALGLPIKRVICAPCVYRPRTMDSYGDKNEHPAFIKDPKYSGQREVRLMWRLDPSIADFKLQAHYDLTCPELKHICSINADDLKRYLA
jgi:hypothetical protein